MSLQVDRTFWRRPQSASTNAQQPIKPLFDFTQSSSQQYGYSRINRVVPEELTPGTLASLTKNKGNAVSVDKYKPMKFVSDDDFPSLGKKKVNNSLDKEKLARPTFAEMSKEWSRKKQEDDEKAKKEAEEEAEKQKKLREFEELERRSWGVGKLSAKTNSMDKRNIKILDIGCDTNDIPLDDDYDYSAVQPPDDNKYEEEEEDDEADSVWNHRRNKNELY